MDREFSQRIALADPAVHSHVRILDALWRIGGCDWLMVDHLLNKSQELSALERNKRDRRKQ
jgi:hypothetical protein